MSNGYEIPEDYDYQTGGFLPDGGKGHMTPNTLNHLLFGVPVSDDNPNKDILEPKKQKRKRVKGI